MLLREFSIQSSFAAAYLLLRMDEITVEVGSATNAHVLPASSAASAAAASIVATESSIDKSDSNSRGRSTFLGVIHSLIVIHSATHG